MKPRKIYIAILILTVVAIGCRQKEHAEMTEAQKLEVLDLKIEKHPNNAALLAERATVLLNLGRTREAYNDANKATKLKPKNTDYLMVLADAALAQGKIEDSYDALTRANQLAPDDMAIQLKLGEITYSAGDFDRSLQHLSRVTQDDPQNRVALTIKGFIYKEKGDTANAVGFLQRVCDLYPDYALPYEELGTMYALNNNPLAVEYLGTVLELEPQNTNAMYTLAMFYQDRQDLDKAEELYNRILDINPMSTDSWHNLGYMELFYYLDYERAIEYLTKAIEADPQSVRAISHRGCAYELSDQFAAARADYEAALALDPNYQEATEGLKRIGKKS